jgi:hypothetical protein
MKMNCTYIQEPLTGNCISNTFHNKIIDDFLKKGYFLEEQTTFDQYVCSTSGRHHFDYSYCFYENNLKTDSNPRVKMIMNYCDDHNFEYLEVTSSELVGEKLDLKVVYFVMLRPEYNFCSYENYKHIYDNNISWLKVDNRFKLQTKECNTVCSYHLSKFRIYDFLAHCRKMEEEKKTHLITEKF